MFNVNAVSGKEKIYCGMTKGHQERVFDLQEKLGIFHELSLTVRYYYPKRKMHRRFQGQAIRKIKNISTTRSLLLLFIPLSSFTSQMVQAD